MVEPEALPAIQRVSQVFGTPLCTDTLLLFGQPDLLICSSNETKEKDGLKNISWVPFKLASSTQKLCSMYLQIGQEKYCNLADSRHRTSPPDRTDSAWMELETDSAHW